MAVALVAGGAGFVGTHLCERLLRDGKRVIALDSLITGRRSNIAHLERNERFQFIEGDVRHVPAFDGPITEIYNLASPASPPVYQLDPVGTTMTNTLGVYNLLCLARDKGAAFFQASTSEVYGDPVEHPQREEYRGNVSCTGPRACYDEGKRCGETLCFDFARMYRVRVHVARLFNCYGPFMSAWDGRVVSNFVRQSLHGEPLTVYGDGSQTRSLMYVSDLINFIVAFMASDEAGPMNVGNPVEMTVDEIADLVIAKTGTSSTKVYLPVPTDDPTIRCPDVTKAKEKLDWEPHVLPHDGIDRLIEYFRGVDWSVETEPEAYKAGLQAILRK